MTANYRQAANHMASGRLSDQMGEVLEALWTAREANALSVEHVKQTAMTDVTDELLDQMEQAGLVSRGGATIGLTARGSVEAEQIIRRHRLAERLVCDVLGMTLEESEAPACEFEHFVAREITDSICTLLGHPRFCPHHHPIPEGECCRKAGSELSSVVTSLDRLNLGEEARIAYIGAANFQRIQKLAALGVSPGVRLRLYQKTPSFVIQCDETQIALEADIARNIYVRRDSRRGGAGNR